MTSPDHFDVAIVGAGAVGLAVAREVSRADFMSGRSVVLLEQETSFGQHISSRNSEVIHAGIYYPSDSLKARLCVRGKALLYEYCRNAQVPHRRLGKLIVAGPGEQATLEHLLRQARDNGVEDLELLDAAALRALESAVTGANALLSPSSGIIDAHEYMVRLLSDSQSQGVVFAPRSRVTRVIPRTGGFEIITEIGGGDDPTAYRFDASVLINSAGLGSMALAHAIEGLAASCIPALHLCKGDYFTYRGRNPFQHLIYPVPEANTTGLGVHATLDMAGRLRFGPDTRYIDAIDYQVETGKEEAFATAIRRYFPAIRADELSPDYAGIRPKLVGPGEAAADFMVQDADTHKLPGLLQLFGIESPGLTASLAIGELVRDRVREFLC